IDAPRLLYDAAFSIATTATTSQADIVATPRVRPSTNQYAEARLVAVPMDFFAPQAPCRRGGSRTLRCADRSALGVEPARLGSTTRMRSRPRNRPSTGLIPHEAGLPGSQRWGLPNGQQPLSVVKPTARPANEDPAKKDSSPFRGRAVDCGVNPLS